MPDNTQAVLDVEELRTVVAEAMELPVEEVTDDARFVEDLELDSLMSLEIAVRLEQRYDIKVDDQELKGIGTFQDVRELTEAKLRAGRSA